MSNASTFRAVARIEEQMMRATMPKTAAADPHVALVRVSPAARVWSAGSLLAVSFIPSLTFNLAEVAHA